MNIRYLSIALIYCLFSSTISIDSGNDQDVEIKARDYMKKLNELKARLQNKIALSTWAHEIDLSNETAKSEMSKHSLESKKVLKEYWLKTQQYPWKSFKDPILRAQFKAFSLIGADALPDKDYKSLKKILGDMKQTYGRANVCEFNNAKKCNLSMEPELTQIFASSRNPDELKYYWTEWRKVSGKKCLSLYPSYVKLSNEFSKLNNLTDYAAYWLENFNIDSNDGMNGTNNYNFEASLKKLWNDVKPFYMELHAYVRRRLRERYGEDVVPKAGAIPAHILGDMWALEWTNIYNITVPFPSKQAMDVTENMKKQGYTPLKMFKLAEQFYLSLNMTAMPESFWNNSVIEKPKGRKLICHASATDLSDGKDFRIKMCTVVNMANLMTIHHEMGHIEYFLQYKDQPYIFRSAANSGFHEAIGDTMTLSVTTPNHLRKIDLLDPNMKDDNETDINFLYYSSLDRVSFLPYAYILDLWRWGIFRGETKPEKYNCQWWNLRRDFQGVEPPVNRSEADFDPAGKYHVVADVPYIRYFVSYILQYQFHRALCEKAGQFNRTDPKARPLHHCDIYNSVKAGNAFKEMLHLGSSKPWPDALEALTGERDLDASAVLQYYAPLYEWLKEDNKRHNEKVGWASEAPRTSWCS